MEPQPRRRGHRPPWAAGQPRRGRGPGVGLAVATGLIQVFGTRAALPESTELWGPAYVLLLLGPFALLFRRKWPVVSYGVTVAATVAYALLPYPRGPFFVAAVAGLFAVGRRGWPGPSGVFGLLGYLVYVLAGHLVPPDRNLYTPGVVQAILVAVVILVLHMLAEANRMRVEFFQQQARVRAEQTRARAEQERRQASEERLRIARELHDVLGHHLSLINVQAGVGLHLMDTKPEQARTSLAAIKEASAEALREVRSVLGALHTEDEDAAPRTPAPSLSRVSTLVEDAGLPVGLEVRGEARPLPAEVDRAGFRIVQEALTNVRRHAGPGATASVLIEYGEELTIRVQDDGAGATEGAASDGTGIPGMRERAVALGGTLVAGPIGGRGWRVVATLPVKEKA